MGRSEDAGNAPYTGHHTRGPRVACIVLVLLLGPLLAACAGGVVPYAPAATAQPTPAPALVSDLVRAPAGPPVAASSSAAAGCPTVDPSPPPRRAPAGAGRDGGE